MIQAEPSSFRDTESRVFMVGNRVLRGFTDSGAQAFLSAHDVGVLQTLVVERMIVDYKLVSPESVPDISPSATVIEADRIEFVSVPAEWSFSMLRDAALLTLSINIELLDHGFILKDASAFNVTFDGSSPVFLDHGSITTIGDAGIWSAYGQFVDHFLTPLFLESYANVAFQPRLRGSVDGIPVQEANALLRGRARRRKGVTTHIVIRNELERSTHRYDKESRSRVAGLALPRSSIKRMMQKLHDLVAGLESGVTGMWTDYENALPYDPDEYKKKLDLVVGFGRRAAGKVLIDVGANTGDFSRALAASFGRVLALDADSGAVDRLYQRLAAGGPTTITPLVVDLLNPTPAVGWVNCERSSFLDRTRGDLGLWLAVVHHLTITGGIPLSHSLSLAANLTRYAVIEFVHPSDPMVELIGATASALGTPYDEGVFEFEMNARFEILEVAEVSRTRRLYFGRSLRK